MRTAARTLFLPWRLGYGLAIVVVLLFYLPFLKDALSYARLGLSFRLALTLSYESVRAGDVQRVVFVVIFLALIMPTLIGMLLVGVPLGSLRSFVARMRSSKAATLYLLLCLVIGALDSVSAQMQIVSGYRNVPGGNEYDFVSWFKLMMDHTVFQYYGLLGGLLSASFIRLLVMVFTGEWAWLEKGTDYLTNARLADLNGEFAPEHGRSQLNFDNSPAPAIRYVERRWRECMGRYWKMVPGSQEAQEYSHNLWQDCRRTLDRISSANLDSDKHTLRLLPSWARAVETALREIPGAKRILVSPYTNPEIGPVMGWLDPTDLAETQRLEFGAGFYSEPWPVQKKKLVERVAAACADRTNVAVLTEVCYFTGRVIKVDELVEAVKHHLKPGVTLRFIVDGSDAIGNLRRPSGPTAGDTYVFAGNRWLMAPEPCGLMITRRAEPRGTSANESQAPALPPSERSVAALAGLWAGLSLWKAIRPERMFERSEQLMKRFLARVESDAVIVGAESGLAGSSIATVKPRPGSQWTAQSADELISQLNSHGIHAEVVSPEAGKLWVRFRFPHYLDGVDVDQAGRTLAKVMSLEKPAAPVRTRSVSAG